MALISVVVFPKTNTSFSTLLFHKKIAFCRGVLAIWKQKWTKEKMLAGLYICQRHVDVAKNNFFKNVFKILESHSVKLYV